MGHTLAAVWDRAEFRRVEELLRRDGHSAPNKVPYGRDCDRVSANRVLPYHMTVFRWREHYDDRFLRALEGYTFRPFEVRVTGVKLMDAEEGSSILYLTAEPGAGFSAFRSDLEARLGTEITSSLHITLAASKDQDNLVRLRQRLRTELSFPFPISVSGLELYHIWRPVRFVRSWPQRP